MGQSRHVFRIIEPAISLPSSSSSTLHAIEGSRGYTYEMSAAAETPCPTLPGTGHFLSTKCGTTSKHPTSPISLFLADKPQMDEDPTAMTQKCLADLLSCRCRHYLASQTSCGRPLFTRIIDALVNGVNETRCASSKNQKSKVREEEKNRSSTRVPA